MPREMMVRVGQESIDRRLCNVELELGPGQVV
jgi:hypothetical protein